MTGDQIDIAARLKRYLPRWFGYSTDPTPVLDALLGGLAAALAHLHALIEFARLQTRIATATGGWLDLAAFDFFGAAFKRFGNEPDGSYSRRIRQEVLRDRNTRNAIDAAVFDLTGRHPEVFEGWHAPTCGGYGTPGLVLGRVGRYGSRTAPFHVIVRAVRPVGYIIPNRGGWGSGTGGYGIGNFSFVDDTSLQGMGAREIDILNSIERVRAAGIRVIVRWTGAGADGDPDT